MKENRVRGASADDVLSWGPCPQYDEARVRRIWGPGRRDALSALALRIPAADRLWAVLRLDMVSAAILWEFTCRCAERALQRERRAGREPDPRSWAVVEARRAWLRGEIDDQALARAGDDAWAARVAIPGVAAWAANVAVLGNGIWAARVAWVAGVAGDVGAAGPSAAAVWVADNPSAERRWQVAELRRMLREEK